MKEDSKMASYIYIYMLKTQMEQLTYIRMNPIGIRQNKKQNIIVNVLVNFILKQMKSSLTEKNL